jgi:hypothetical protein
MRRTLRESRSDWWANTTSTRTTTASSVHCRASGRLPCLAAVSTAPRSLTTGESFRAKRVRYLHISSTDAKGPCWARSRAQGLYDGEDYVLQIDSHMRFRPHWDAYLIETLHSCPSDKPVLTAYPVGYDLPERVPDECRPTHLCPVKFGEDDGLLRQVHTKQRCRSPALQPPRAGRRGACWLACRTVPFPAISGPLGSTSAMVAW